VGRQVGIGLYRSIRGLNHRPGKDLKPQRGEGRTYMNQLQKIQLIMQFDKSAKFNTLEALPIGDLDRMLAEIEKDKHSSQGMHGIFQTVIDGRVVEPCIANENIIRGWVDEARGETFKDMGPRWFRRILRESPALINSLVWESADLLDPKKRSQIEADTLAQSRKAFGQTARRLKAFGFNEANFQATLAILGNSFNEYQVEQLWLAGALRHLSSASAEELESWKQEKLAQENELLKADAVTPYQLQEQKEIRQRRFTDSRRSAVQEELERQLVVGFQKEVTFGGKKFPMPYDYHGEKLDAQFIKRCSADVLRKLISIFGSSQISARLHNLTRASAVLDYGDGKGPRTVEVEF
jgi:hypothetical protein